MIRIANLTLTRLLDHAEAHAARMATGRQSVPARAFAADIHGVVTVFGFPVPASEADRQALAAILQTAMTKRHATVSVLLLQASVKLSAAAEGDPVECVVLEGQQLRPRSKSESRILTIERQGRKIVRLRRLTVFEAQEGAANVGSAPQT